MTTALAEKANQEVARPLNILTPLIKQDFDEGEKAGMAYFKRAGEKLIEAKEGHFDGRTAEFYKWAERTFGKKITQIKAYMSVGALTDGKSFKSIREFQRSQGNESATSAGAVRRPWIAPVDEVAEKARREAFRLAQEEELTRAQERDAERQLARRLIDIGYRVLAKELHPDKMGDDRGAMARLNRVRDKLKHSI